MIEYTAFIKRPQALFRAGLGNLLEIITTQIPRYWTYNYYLINRASIELREEKYGWNIPVPSCLELRARKSALLWGGEEWELCGKTVLPDSINEGFTLSKQDLRESLRHFHVSLPICREALEFLYHILDSEESIERIVAPIEQWKIHIGYDVKTHEWKPIMSLQALDETFDEIFDLEFFHVYLGDKKEWSALRLLSHDQNVLREFILRYFDETAAKIMGFSEFILGINGHY